MWCTSAPYPNYTHTSVNHPSYTRVCLEGRTTHFTPSRPCAHSLSLSVLSSVAHGEKRQSHLSVSSRLTQVAGDISANNVCYFCTGAASLCKQKHNQDFWCQIAGLPSSVKSQSVTADKQACDVTSRRFKYLHIDCVYSMIESPSLTTKGFFTPKAFIKSL